MRYFIILLLLLITAHGSGQILNDKGLEKKAIICLTYDDALESQWAVAIPQLHSFGFKATFFLNSIKGSTEIFAKGEQSILEWKKAAQNGHELANHTLFHACPEEIGWQKELAIEGYTLDQLLKEIETTNLYLSLIDPSRKERAFAYPCGNVMLGETDYSEKLRDSKLVTYARIGGDETSIVRDFKTLDTMQVPSWHVSWQGMTTEAELIAFAEKVKESGGLGIYQFHGIGSPLFNLSPAVHRRFLEYLKANQNVYWVTTFLEAMD